MCSLEGLLLICDWHLREQRRLSASPLVFAQKPASGVAAESFGMPFAFVASHPLCRMAAEIAGGGYTAMPGVRIQLHFRPQDLRSRGEHVLARKRQLAEKSRQALIERQQCCCASPLSTCSLRPKSETAAILDNNLKMASVGKGDVTVGGVHESIGTNAVPLLCGSPLQGLGEHGASHSPQIPPLPGDSPHCCCLGPSGTASPPHTNTMEWSKPGSAASRYVSRRSMLDCRSTQEPLLPYRSVIVDSPSRLEKMIWWLVRVPIIPLQLKVILSACDTSGDKTLGTTVSGRPTAKRSKKSRVSAASFSAAARSSVLSFPFPALGALFQTIEVRDSAPPRLAVIKLHQRLHHLMAFSVAGSTLRSPALDTLQGARQLSCVFLDYCPNITKADVLSSCPQLRVFSAVRTPLQSIDWMQWCTRLEEVYLSHTSLIQSYAVLGKLNHLRVLHLAYTKNIGNKDVLCWLSDCRSLQELNIRGCHEVRDCSPLMHLQELRVFLAGDLPRIVELGAWVREWRDLAMLDMEGCGQLTSVSSLGFLETLQHVNLSGTSISSLDWVGERCRDSLETLLLHDCKNVKHWHPITRAKYLNRLDVRWSTLDTLEWMVSCPLLVEVMMDGAEIKTLPHRLSGAPELNGSASRGAGERRMLPPPSSQGGSAVEPAAADTEEKNSVNHGFIKVASALKLRYLTALSLNDCALDTIDWITGCPAITKLSFSGCRSLTDLQPIGFLTQLLYVNANLTGVRNIQWMLQCPSLIEVHLKGCLALTAFQPLALLRSLQTLDLSHTAISSLEMFRDHASLHTLYLCGCKNVDDFAVLSSISNLTNLDVSITGLCDIRWISACRHLREVDLSSCRSLSRFEALATLPELQTLSLKKMDFSDLSWLKACQALRKLYVSGSTFPDNPVCWGLFLPKQVEYIDVCAGH